MKTFYDIQQFLKKYGTIIYTGDRVADVELMEDEVKELYRSKLVDIKDFQIAVMVLRQEMTRLREKGMGNND